MQCPMCGGAIVFPAVLPSRGGKPVAGAEAPKPRRNWAWNATAIYHYLRDYPHWRTMGQVAVPFVIVGALLAGAAYVKNKFSDQPESAAAPVVQEPSGGWDHMTALARADQKMQQHIQRLGLAKKALMAAKQSLSVQQKNFSQVHGSDEQQAAQSYLQAAERAEAQAQKTYDACRTQFQADGEIYRKLGGTVDYYSRAP
jgi:hypothetical protein